MSLLLLFRNNFNTPYAPVFPEQVTWVVVESQPINIVSEDTKQVIIIENS